ncbi:MAG: hypothetical protein M8866_01910, partial [marine benthic group bacterium]|nr:hypothetical protein [Candidatus Benthicola marisminoris]
MTKFTILKTAVLAASVSVFGTACTQSREATNETAAGGETTMPQPEVKGPRVLLETSEGNILLGFYPEEAPLSV